MTSTGSSSPWFPVAAQAVVAVFVGAVLVSLAGWFVAGGGLTGGLVVPTPPRSGSPLFTLDVNAAPARELAQLPGLGPAMATRIIEHRDRHGPFTTAEGLLAVPGIGPATLARIRPHLQPLPSPAAGTSPYRDETTP